MKVITSLFLFIIFTLNIFAQTGTLKGKVVDKESDEPLIGANVIIKELNTGAATDVDGNYIIYNISPGNYYIKVAYIGYKTIEIENTKIIADECVLNFEMTISDSEGIIIHQRFVPKNKTACTFRIPVEPLIIPIKGFYFESYKDKLKTHPLQMDSIKIDIQ